MARARSVVLLAAMAAAAAPLGAQVRVHGMAQAVPTLVSARPMPGGGGLSEVRVLQPVAMATLAAGPGWRLRGTLNAEGLTMAGGELSPGAWGEGFFDRRHPHTWLHELVAWNGDLLGTADRGWAVGLAAGKGFAPFGTDDPMVRPFLRYPVNHHWAQLLERLLALGAVRAGPVAVEAALFNGDEPEGPAQWPNASRFGDSWSVRAFAWPVPGLELQGSYARVASPEHRPGAGPEARKGSASARWVGTLGGLRAYALAEWARTTEAGGAFRYATGLAEMSVARRGHRVSYRFERTSRPEEEREADLFRAPRPHLDDNVLGRTRWTLHTARWAWRTERRPLGLEPFAEVTLGRVARAGTGLFDPGAYYGSRAVRAVTAGVRVDLGGTMGRMGRYGVVEAQDARGEPARAHH